VSLYITRATGFNSHNLLNLQGAWTQWSTESRQWAGPVRTAPRLSRHSAARTSGLSKFVEQSRSSNRGQFDSLAAVHRGRKPWWTGAGCGANRGMYNYVLRHELSTLLLFARYLFISQWQRRGKGKEKGGKMKGRSAPSLEQKLLLQPWSCVPYSASEVNAVQVHTITAHNAVWPKWLINREMILWKATNWYDGSVRHLCNSFQLVSTRSYGTD